MASTVPLALHRSEEAVPELSLLQGQLPLPPAQTSSKSSDSLAVARSSFPIIVSLFTEPERIPDLLQEYLHPDGFWRDLVAFSHTFRTFHRLRAIAPALQHLVRRAKPVADSFQLVEPAVQVVTLPNGTPFISVTFHFDVSLPHPARCTAMAKLLAPCSPDEQPKLWVLTTFFDYFKGLEPVDLTAPSQSLEPPPVEMPSSTDVLVIGGSQSGLSMSIRLKALGVDHCVVDTEPNVGDSWRQRYRACKLHTSPAFSGLPFADYPTDDPLQIPGTLIADFYEAYVNRFKLPVYPGRCVQRAVWSDAEDAWIVIIDGKENGHGQARITAKHLVFAIGLGCRRPLVPRIPGHEQFKGDVMHSAVYQDATPWRGRRGIVIGCANTGMDVACDFVDCGLAETSIIQRSPTRIYTLDDIHAIKAPLWDRKKPTELADMIASSDPIAIQDRFSESFLRGRKPESAALVAALRKTPFRFIDEGSHFQQVYTSAGRHYIDVGGLKKIIDGEIKVKSGIDIKSFTPTGLAFVDGSTIDADVIVYATGFEKSWRKPIEDVVGAVVADQVQTEVWGVTAEGEIRGFWKPSGHPRIWLTGGDLMVPRYFSKFLANQILASLKGIEFAPYND